MPQMAPLMWLILFMVFIFLCIFTSSKMYFNTPKFTKSKDLNNMSEPMNMINWKW